MAERLWMMSIHASVMIPVVLAVRVLLQKYPKELSYGLWIAVLMRLLCPIFIESPMSLWPESWRVTETVEEELLLDTEQAGEEAVFLPGETEAELPVAEEPQSAGTAEEKTASMGAEAVLRLLYYTGAAALMLVFAGQYVIMRRRVAAAVHEQDNIWLCEEIPSPFVLGLIRPRVCLPFGIPGEERVYVISHEQMHIRHGDLWLRFLALAALCLHWWNPLVWYGLHKMFQDMEMCCDEAVMKGKSLEAKKEYSSMMLKYAMQQSGYAGIVSFGQSNTERRVRNILKNKKRSVPAYLFIILFVQFCVYAFFTVPVRGREALNKEQMKTMLPDMGNYSVDDMPVHLEEIVLSDNMVLSSGKTFRVQLVMTEGEYFSAEYAGAGGGIYEENYSGNYELRALDSEGRLLSACPVRDEDSGERFNFGNSFELALEDYNQDGCVDFTLGSWGSSSMGLYYLYTISDTGEIIPAYEEGIADVGLAYSRRFERMEQGGFAVYGYSNATGEYSRIPYYWEEDEGRYVRGEEMAVSEGMAESP